MYFFWYLSASPGYIPPLANFDCDSTEVTVRTASAASASKKIKKGKDTRKEP